MAKLIMRLTCSFGLLALVGLTGAATAAAPAHDQPVTPRSAAAAPIAERMAACRSYRCYGLRKGCRVVRDPYPAPIGFAAPPRCDGGDPVLHDQ